MLILNLEGTVLLIVFLARWLMTDFITFLLCEVTVQYLVYVDCMCLVFAPKSLRTKEHARALTW